MVALAAIDRVGTAGARALPAQTHPSRPAAAWGRLKGPKRWASPSYGINVIALALAVALAAALAVLLWHLVPQLLELVMPPPLSGPH